MDGKDIESTAEQSGSLAQNISTESKEEPGNRLQFDSSDQDSAVQTAAREEVSGLQALQSGGDGSNGFFKKVSAGGDSLATSLGLKQVSKSLKRKQLDAITDDTTYRWLFTSIPERFGGPLIAETDGPSSEGEPAANDELDPDNAHHWQNYAIAWIILASQLAIYIAISVVAVQAIKDYKDTPYGTVSCSDPTRAATYDTHYTISSATAPSASISGGAIKYTRYYNEYDLVPTCVVPQQSEFMSYFVGMTVLFGYTFGDRTVVVLLWQNGLRLTALGIAVVLLMAYVATGLAIYVSTYNGGSALDVVTTSVGIIFVNDLDEKFYHYLKVMKSPARRLVSIFEVLVLALAFSAVFYFGPLKDDKFVFPSSDSVASSSTGQ